MTPTHDYFITGLAGVAGAAYAFGLWTIATSIAGRRSLEIGRFPWWLIAVCGALSTLVYRLVDPDVALLTAATLVGTTACALVDARTGFIFDALSLIVAGVAAVAAARCGHLADGLLAVAAAGTILGGLYALTRRRGIGLGDVKLGCALALGLGLSATITAIGIAFVLGAIYGIARIASRRAQRTDAVRFGPFIAGGSAIAVLAGSPSGWF